MYPQQQLDEEKRKAEYWKNEFYAASDRLHRLIDKKTEQKPVDWNEHAKNVYQSSVAPVKDWEVWAYEEKFGVRDYSYEYGHVIKAVKRLSDGVVFSVGDKVGCCFNSTEFVIGKIDVSGEPYFINRGDFHHYALPIRNAIKLPSPKPSPLFTISEIIKCYEKSAPLYSPLFNSFIENLTQSKISTI